MTKPKTYTTATGRVLTDDELDAIALDAEHRPTSEIIREACAGTSTSQRSRDPTADDWGRPGASGTVGPARRDRNPFASCRSAVPGRIARHERPEVGSSPRPSRRSSEGVTLDGGRRAAQSRAIGVAATCR